MAVESDGSYGVPKGLIFSFPVTIKDGEWSIVKGIKMTGEEQAKMDATIAELVGEKAAVADLLK